MRSITYDQAKQLKDNGIEIPESEVTGFYNKDYSDSFTSFEANDKKMIKASGFDEYYLKTTDLEGLWNMLSPNITDHYESSKIKIYDKCLAANNTVFYIRSGMGRNEIWKDSAFYNIDPKQSIIDMLCYLKKEELK